MGIKLGLNIVKRNPPRTDLLEKIQNNLDESIDLIQDYFQLEQYKNSKFLKDSPLDLKALVNEILEELNIDIKRKNIELQKNFPDNDIIIKTNKEWLKKALFNIIQNAIKYNKENGLLTVGIETAKYGYLLIVKDTGIGIKAEDRAKVFDKYYTKDKTYGTGIGLSFSKLVIENLGGKIHFESQENKGTLFFIYLPKISKKIKLKVLATSLAVMMVMSAFVLDYFYCMIPQNLKIETFHNMKIIKFENGAVAKVNKNDKIQIIAYKNLFNTRTRNEIKLQHSDMQLATNGNKIKIITPNTTFTNLGTNFETVVNEKTAVSVFQGKIKSKKIVVNADEGLIVSDTAKKTVLPIKVSNIKISNNPLLKIKWNSKYEHFKILISHNKKFNELPIYQYNVNKIEIKPKLPDGEWFISIKAVYDDLYSPPVIRKFISLNNYYTALSCYHKNNLTKALMYIKKSISTINGKSYKPYLLYAKILFKMKKYNKALIYINQAETINSTEEGKFLKAKIFYIQKKYKKLIKILKNPITIREKFLILKAYYNLGQYKKVKKYLYQILEKDPQNKEALKFLNTHKNLKNSGILNELN